MEMISKRKITIGIVGTIIIIFFNFLNGLYELFNIDYNDSLNLKLIINTIIFYYCYITIWIIIRDIVVKKIELIEFDKYFLWIIRLLSATGVILIINYITRIDYLYYLIVLIGLVGFVIFLIILNKLMKINSKEIRIINHLQNFMLLFLILAFVKAIIGSIGDIIKLFNQTEKIYNLNYIKYFIDLIPFSFLLLFFLDVKKDLNEGHNVNA